MFFPHKLGFTIETLNFIFFFPRGSENAETFVTLCVLTDFFFPSVANNSGFVRKVGAQIEQYTTGRSCSGTLGLDFLLYIPPQMLIHIHFDSLLTDNFLLKNQ